MTLAPEVKHLQAFKALEILVAVTMEGTIFRVLTSISLEDVHGSFGGTYFIYLQGSLLSIPSDPEDGGSTFLRNVLELLLDTGLSMSSLVGSFTGYVLQHSGKYTYQML
jgi:hypothetical protein